MINNMNEITRVPLPPKYKRDNGVTVLDTQVSLPAGFNLKETSLVAIPAGAIAGNHRHPRQEAFICFQQGVELHWIDALGGKHSQAMQPASGEHILFVVPSMLPHAVVNMSSSTATVFAYADGPLVSTEQIPVA